MSFPLYHINLIAGQKSQKYQFGLPGHIGDGIFHYIKFSDRSSPYISDMLSVRGGQSR